MADIPTIEQLSDQIEPFGAKPLRSAPRLGRSGLKQSLGYISEDFVAELRGAQAYKVYDEMRRNEPVIQAMLNAVTTLLMMTEYKIVPRDKYDGADVAAAQFVAEAFERLNRPYEDIMSDILTMLPFGWALLEIQYVYTEGRVWWGSLDLRSQDTLDRWEFDEEGELKGFWQVAPPDFRPRYIPERKFLLFRTSAEKGNPEGMSLLRAAYKPYYYKKILEEIEAQGAERDLLGIPVMEVPFGATPDEIEAAQRVVENIKNDDQAGILETAIGPNPEDRFRFRLVTGQGSSTKVSFTDRLINRYAAEMTAVMLAQFIRIGGGGAGGYRAVSDQRDIFQIAVRGFLKRIESVWNRVAIPRLLAMNGLSGRCYIDHGRVTQLDLQTLANFVTAGVQNKWLTANRELENFLRAAAEFPELSPTEEAASEATAAAPTPPLDNSGLNSNPGANQYIGASEGDDDAEIWEEYERRVLRQLAEGARW